MTFLLATKTRHKKATAPVVYCSNYIDRCSNYWFSRIYIVYKRL